MLRSSNATGLLARWSDGDRAALDEVIALLYEQLRSIAARQLHGEQQLTLQPTALVNEVYMRLVQLNRIEWQDRQHFLSMFARVARQTLVDEARKYRAAKRGADLGVTLTDERGGAVTGGYGMLELDELMTQLQAFDASAAQVMELRVFGGMSIEEAALQLGISEATISRKWRAGKAWIARQLAAPPPALPAPG